MPGFGKLKDGCTQDALKHAAAVSGPPLPELNPIGNTAKIYKPSKWDLKVLTPFCVYDLPKPKPADMADDLPNPAGKEEQKLKGQVYLYKWGYNLPLLIALGLALLVVLLLLFKLLHRGNGDAPPPPGN